MNQRGSSIRSETGWEAAAAILGRTPQMNREEQEDRLEEISRDLFQEAERHKLMTMGPSSMPGMESQVGELQVIWSHYSSISKSIQIGVWISPKHELHRSRDFSVEVIHSSSWILSNIMLKENLVDDKEEKNVRKFLKFVRHFCVLLQKEPMASLMQCMYITSKLHPSVTCTVRILEIELF